jgi:hypothetical protein
VCPVPSEPDIRDGEPVHFVSIADFLMGLQPVPEKFEELERQLRLFAEQKPISIRSASKLAEMMGHRSEQPEDGQAGDRKTSGP